MIEKMCEWVQDHADVRHTQTFREIDMQERNRAAFMKDHFDEWFSKQGSKDFSAYLNEKINHLK